VLCTRHDAPPTPSAAYDPRASSPPTYFDKFTPMGGTSNIKHVKLSRAALLI